MFVSLIEDPDFMELDYFGSTIRCPKDGYLHIAMDAKKQYYAIVYTTERPTTQYYHEGDNKTSYVISYIKLDGRYDFAESIYRLDHPKVLSIVIPKNKKVKFKALNIEIEIPENRRSGYMYLYKSQGPNNIYDIMISSSYPIEKKDKNLYGDNYQSIARIETDSQFNLQYILASIQSF